MSILVVGGDRLGNITRNLKTLGFTEVRHLNGRKKGDLEFKVPEKTDVVLVLIDFVGHEVVRKIKKEARSAGYKTVFARRSWAHIGGAV